MKKTAALLIALSLVGVASAATAGAATVTTDAGDQAPPLAPNCTGPPETQDLCHALCPVIEKLTGQPCA